MILWESEAYQYAQDHADKLVRIDLFGEELCRVVLEGDPDDPDLPPVIESWSPELPAGLQEINARLEAKGWPAMSPYWVKTIALCYFAQRRNQIFRVGRRGGKSSSICRVAIYECIFGDHKVPPGDVGVFAIISALVSQAKDRIRDLTLALTALGVDHHATQYGIDFKGTTHGAGSLGVVIPAGRSIRCFAATRNAVVSFTCIGAMCDEEAYWRDDDTGANPATEVLGALRPTMATMPNAKLWHISAPWSTLDAHYEAFERGLQPDQIAFYAPSWVANPTLTEAGTHIDEPDIPTWERQYLALPSAADETKFFNAALIDQACKIQLEGGRPAAGGDFAFRKDSSGLVVADGDEATTRLLLDREWLPGRLPLRPSVVISEAIGEAKAYGCESICTDLHYVETVREETDEQGLSLTEFPSSQEEIAKAYVNLRVKLARGRVDLSRASVKLIRDLKGTRSRIDKSGMHIEPGEAGASGHGDLVSALICANYSLGTQTVRGNSASSARRIQSARHSAQDSSGKWTERAPED